MGSALGRYQLNQCVHVFKELGVVRSLSFSTEIPVSVIIDTSTGMTDLSFVLQESRKTENGMESRGKCGLW